MAVETTFVVGPDATTCEQIRAEFTRQALEKADQAFAAGDELHGHLWLRVGQWIEEGAQVRP